MKQFLFLWKHAVLNALENVWEELSEKDRQEYNVKRRDSEEDMLKVKALYEEFRDFTKSRFFDTGEDGNNLMDVHKIASCFTGALVRYKLLRYDLKEDLPVGLVLSNYAVAFLTGINILYIADLSDNCCKNRDIYRKLYNKKTFEFPETTYGHDPYVQGRIKTLAVNDLNGVDFDILTYADMLFWIEKYNYDLMYSQFCQG